MVKGIKTKSIELDGGFKVIHVLSKPPRLEAKIIFDRDHISQKLIFTLMDISHAHGFGCSKPQFGNVDDSDMIFLIGTILPSSRSLDKYLARLNGCLTEMRDFAQEFMRQLDFSQLDISMFSGLDADVEIYPEQLAALRDQLYNGSWEDFHEAMRQEGREDMADIALQCMKFEDQNDKDLGFVGHKLGYMLDLLSNQEGDEVEIN